MTPPQKIVQYICKTCDKRGTYNAWDEEPPCFFYQVKKLGTVKYIIEYDFCSNACMMAYMKKSKK